MWTRTTGCAMYRLDLSLSVRCIVSCSTWLLSVTSSARGSVLGPATGSASSHSSNVRHNTHWKTWQVHRRRNRGGGARPPTFSLQGPYCFSPPPQLEPKIKQLQHTHKPRVTFYMCKLYLMAAPSFMFHLLHSFWRSLLLEASFQPEIHQIPFGGQAPPGPAGGAKALPQTP